MAFQEVIGAGGCEPRSGCELSMYDVWTIYGWENRGLSFVIMPKVDDSVAPGGASTSGPGVYVAVTAPGGHNTSGPCENQGY